MRQGLLVGFVVAVIVGSGAFAISMPSILPSSSRLSDSRGIAFECEDLIEGDRVEIRAEMGSQSVEIRVEANTRVRAEVRFDDFGWGWDGRRDFRFEREAKLDLCGIVQFVDEDGNGRLTTADLIIRSELVAFGLIDHRPVDGAHEFETRSEEGNMTVALRIPSVLPPEDQSLIEWFLLANPDCDSDATHFAVKLEQKEPFDADRFFAERCGSTLTVRSDAPPPRVGDLECEDLFEGKEFTIVLSEQDGRVERTFVAQVEADTRVRAEAEFVNGTFRDWGWDRRGREARVELCGFLQFSDEGGDGTFGPDDTVISTALVRFDTLGHLVDAGFHVFEAVSVDGNLTVTIRVPATFPAEDELLLRWSLEASPTCEAGASHFAVKLEQRAMTKEDRFFVAACGTTLTAAGEAG